MSEDEQTQQEAHAHELFLDTTDLSLLAYMAHIGTHVVRQQLIEGYVPEDQIEPTKAMLRDSDHLLAQLRHLVEEEMGGKDDESPLSELGKPAVGTVQ